MQIAPLPDSTVAHVDESRKPTKEIFNWFRSLEFVLGKFSKETDLGTPVSSGTVTISLNNGPKQKLTNNAAFTLAAPAEIGTCELRITNGASAGSITFSGFTKKYTSDALDTTESNQFVVRIYGYGAAGADYEIKARQ